MKYTLKLHVHRLKLMLKRPKPCVLCPAKVKFIYHSDHIGDEKTHPFIDYSDRLGPCIICQDFVEVYGGCPCHRLINPIKTTLLKIEEYERKNKR